MIEIELRPYARKTLIKNGRKLHRQTFDQFKISDNYYFDDLHSVLVGRSNLIIGRAMTCQKLENHFRIRVIPASLFRLREERH